MGVERAGDYRRKRLENEQEKQNYKPLPRRDVSKHGNYKITPEVIGIVADCLGNRWPEWRIRKLVCETAGGRLPTHTLQKIITKGKELNRERFARPTSEHKQDAVAFYESVIANEALPLKERLFAQARLDSLLGLEARYSISSDPAETAEKARAILAAIEITVTGEQKK